MSFLIPIMKYVLYDLYWLTYSHSIYAYSVINTFHYLFTVKFAIDMVSLHTLIVCLHNAYISSLVIYWMRFEISLTRCSLYANNSQYAI